MDRLHIPAQLERQLMLEVGYRCAICKATEPLEIEHIEEYAKVQKHEFHNMIVLCRNCHGRKAEKANPRKIDRKALRNIKNDLMLLNGRYSDLERRVLDKFSAKHRPYDASMDYSYDTYIPAAMKLLVSNLERDGLATLTPFGSGLDSRATGSSRTSYQVEIGLHDFIKIELTEKGQEFIQKLVDHFP